MGDHGLFSPGWVYGKMGVSGEHINDSSISIQCEEILGQLSDHEFHKINSAPRR